MFDQTYKKQSKNKQMKFIALIATLLISFSINAQNLEFLNGIDYMNFSNEKYGNAQRNVFDIFIPKSNKPTALIIYIHAGGFVAGDKDDAINWRKEDIRFFLNKKIAFASINYQFYKTNDSIGVGQCLNDIKRAIQFIRHHANKYNIDKNL
jgi:acetyl esterase/lipase